MTSHSPSRSRSLDQETGQDLPGIPRTTILHIPSLQIFIPITVLPLFPHVLIADLVNFTVRNIYPVQLLVFLAPVKEATPLIIMDTPLGTHLISQSISIFFLYFKT